jgi:hypothetical protein
MTCLSLSALPAFAQSQPAPTSGFRGLWTGWGAANADSMKVERGGVTEVRREYQSGGSERRRQLETQGRDLGERVGEIVRLGDCAEGERVARAAGDFALVKAVRDHCEAIAAAR